MKKFPLRVRNHYGYTARRVAVKAYRPWYYQLVVALLFVGLGFGLSYFMMSNSDYKKIGSQLVKMQYKNKTLEFKLIEAQRQLQIELEANNTLAKAIAKVQDENLMLKEDLLFYKKMTIN
jgi:hypothetical protein